MLLTETDQDLQPTLCSYIWKKMNMCKRLPGQRLNSDLLPIYSFSLIFMYWMFNSENQKKKKKLYMDLSMHTCEKCVTGYVTHYFLIKSRDRPVRVRFRWSVSVSAARYQWIPISDKNHNIAILITNWANYSWVY